MKFLDRIVDAAINELQEYYRPRSYKMESLIYVQDSLKLALEEMPRKQRMDIQFYTSGSDT